VQPKDQRRKGLLEKLDPIVRNKGKIAMDWHIRARLKHIAAFAAKSKYIMTVYFDARLIKAAQGK
jgi:hypothetical protein